MAVATRQSEKELIEAAQQGDAGAFGSIYDLFADRVYRHILYRIGSPSDAEDLMQQTFMKAWQAIGRYRISEVPLIAWLLTIAHNSVVSYFRGKRDSVPLNIEMSPPDGAGEPYDALERRYDQAIVRRAVAALPAEQQMVVSMHFLEELDYTDIARALGKTENNIRVIAHRGLKRMRAAMEGRA